jgi:hypothetical protein
MPLKGFEGNGDNSIVFFLFPNIPEYVRAVKRLQVTDIARLSWNCPHCPQHASITV